MIGAVATGWVGDLGDGERFSAHVDYGDPSPFSFLLGPESVDTDTAVAWAQAHAERVVVRVGDRHFSAGARPARDLPPWPGPVGSWSGAPSEGEPLRWRVDAHVAWFRTDAANVAARFAQALGAEPSTHDVSHHLPKTGFAVSFALECPSKLEAYEMSSRLLRSAWDATGVAAVPGEDFDGPSVSVRRA